mmetsp:Transcript_33952/g.73205  ORF Transcript_33952/g.73205 Transcript_33952/m.73205 type:complete len:197 (+) Transcript_33952:20-610(+)
MSGQPKKVVLIGDFGVGKSTTLMQLCRRRFGAAVTEALDMKQKEFCVQNGRKKITLQIWDTAGLEKTDSLAVNFFRHSAGVVLVFDTSKVDSFHNVDSWYNRATTEARDVQVLLLGNNFEGCEAAVSEDQAQEYCRRKGILYFSVSARNGTNIDEAFQALAEEIYKTEQEYAPVSEDIVETVTLDGQDANRRRGCC